MVAYKEKGVAGGLPPKDEFISILNPLKSHLRCGREQEFVLIVKEFQFTKASKIQLTLR